MKSTPSNRERFGYLPYVLSLLLPEIGEDGVMTLVEHFGGLRLHVGDSARAKKTLSEKLGDELSEKIVEVVSREKIIHFDTPILSSYKSMLKRKKIAQEYFDENKLVREIARNFGMSERGVYKAIQTFKDNGEIFHRRQRQDFTR